MKLRYESLSLSEFFRASPTNDDRIVCGDESFSEGETDSGCTARDEDGSVLISHDGSARERVIERN